MKFTIAECKKEILLVTLKTQSGEISSVDGTALIISLLNHLVHLQGQEIEELKLVQMRKFEEFTATEVRNTGRKLTLVK